MSAAVLEDLRDAERSLRDAQSNASGLVSLDIERIHADLRGLLARLTEGGPFTVGGPCVTEEDIN